MLAWEARQMPPQLSESDAAELKEKKAQPDLWASDREKRACWHAVTAGGTSGS